jgi:hypothetical protein
LKSLVVHNQKETRLRGAPRAPICTLTAVSERPRSIAVSKDSVVLASHWSGPHGGGWTRSGAGGILLGPFTQCIRAWRSEIAEKMAQAIGICSVPVRFHEPAAFVKHVARGSGQSDTVSRPMNPIVVVVSCACYVSVANPSLRSA